MTEKERMTREIQEFIQGNMSWKSALDLIIMVFKSQEWIDYLLMEMELRKYFENDTKCVVSSADFEA